MRSSLLVLNHSYFFFGATIYVGTLWSLRFFFYPSWKSLTVGNVGDHGTSWPEGTWPRP